MKRNPNTKCCICEKAIYRRPNQLSSNVYCSKKCTGIGCRRKDRTCPICKKDFIGDKQSSKFCSRECSNKNRIGSKYFGKVFSNETQRRLSLLQDNFKFQHCMVDGCNYNKTYDVHRHIPGNEGGKYEIGNMFAICPQHHAEITRKIIKVEMVNNCLLKPI